MGEDSTGLQSGRRVTVDEAARHLGLTVDAVRKRVQRGQMAHEKDAAGRVRIILDIPGNTSTIQDERPDSTGQAAGADAREELIEELRDRVASLERQLQRHGDETERLHQIVAGLAQANAEQARTIRAIEAPASQEPQDAETVEEEPERTEYQPEAAGPQADAEPAPEAPESDEAGHQKEPQDWETSEAESGPGDWTLPYSREQAEAAVVPGSDEEQHDAQDLEPAEAEIATGEVRQEASDDTPPAGQEAAESPVSVENQREERMLHQQKEWERISNQAEEHRAASEAARRRPWYRRIFGR